MTEHSIYIIVGHNQDRERLSWLVCWGATVKDLKPLLKLLRAAARNYNRGARPWCLCDYGRQSFSPPDPGQYDRSFMRSYRAYVNRYVRLAALDSSWPTHRSTAESDIGYHIFKLSDDHTVPSVLI